MHIVNLKGSKVTSWQEMQIEDVKVWLYDPWEYNLVEKLRSIIAESSRRDLIPRVKEFLNRFSKEFALIIQIDGNELLAFVDHIQSHSLFYAKKGKETYITDHPSLLPGKLIEPLSAENIIPFLMSSYTLGNRTLSSGVCQIPAGSYIKASGNDLVLESYYDYWNHSEDKFNVNEKEQEFRSLVLKIVGEFLERFGDRQLVLMLSGGYDSRLILWALDQMKADNVLLCSYGRYWQRDVLWSGRFARHFSYPWVHIPNTFRNVRDTFKSADFRDYYQCTHRLYCKPFFQDVWGIKGLRDKGLLEDDAIFITGNSGDFISGGHLPGQFIEQPDLETCVQSIIDKHFIMWDWNSISQEAKEVIKGQIYSDLLKAPLKYDNPTSLYEWWEWRERQSKLITISIQEFNWFGYMNYLPLWDKEIMRFFQTVPDYYRLNQKFYRNFCEKLTTREGISFKQTQHTVPEKATSILPKIRRSLEYAMEPRIGGLSYNKIMQARRTARQFLGSGKLSKLPQFNAINSGELIAQLIEKHSCS